jgi:hypothetical protein
LAGLDSIEAMRRKDVVMRRLDRVQIQVVQARRDQIGEKQMWEQRKLPGIRFFVVEHEVNDFSQVRVSLFIILLQSLFQLPEGD